MKKKIGWLLLIIILMVTATAAARPDPNFYIFLCFGQSNMDGAGRIEQQDRTVDERFQFLAAVDMPKFNRKKGKWYPAVPPLCRATSGISPADYFGRTLVANLPDSFRVGVINVAVPGCKIELFEKDAYQAYADTAPAWMTGFINDYDGNPYQTLVNLAKVAQKEGVIKGILLHQGESNSNDYEWPNKVKGIYDNLISDLNLKAENVPLLAGETVHAAQKGVCAGMNRIMAMLPEAVPNSYVISSAGCACGRDHLHFNSTGNREFGTRYAGKMLSLLGCETEGPVTMTVYTDQITKTVSKGIYGQFLEHIFNSVHGGLWGDQILNGTLELRPPRPNWMRHDREEKPPRAPMNWELIGDSSDVRIDRQNPFNADVSVRLAARSGSRENPGISQKNIALEQGETYTFSLYARGSGNLIVTFKDGDIPVFTKTFTGLSARWQKYTVGFTSTRSVFASTLTIGSSSAGPVNVDLISLFSKSALATGGYRPDLLKAVAALQPASIRWPGGSFANLYIWQNGIGPHEKRLPHPIPQWGDRDTYQFGTDEFIQFCEKVGAEPVLVLNTSRGVEDALNWLEYCMGSKKTRYGRMRAANGHPEPYQLKTLEIGNEPWLRMDYPEYLDIVKKFCPAIRARYPDLKLSVAGSYGYDTGPGEGNQEANRNWDPRIIEDAGKLFDILSPHYYNGIYFTADQAEDPYKYEQFLKGRGEIIRKSDNPDIRIYVSEWNLTEKSWGNDWRVGLYAGGILNAFERQGDMVTMSCPALFMRKQGVTKSWDNALINFDQETWFPAGNYAVMKLWRECYAPNLLAVNGPERPLNFVATTTADKRIIYLKVVNPTTTTLDAAVRFVGELMPRSAIMQLIAPGSETVRNTLDEPDNIKVVPASAALADRTVNFTMPSLSAAVVRITLDSIQTKKQEFQPTFESLENVNPVPEWFKDAKFGIYFHWGVYSVPAFANEWYPRSMYIKGSPENKHHTEVYGDVFQWPYDHFITGDKDKEGNFVQFAPKLKSEGGQFDPDEWAQLFADAGAKFAGPVAEHHDGFSMWASKVNPWNAKDTGPKLDLVGLLTEAIRKKNMKVILSMHHAYNITGYYSAVPQTDDPKLQMLYGQQGKEKNEALWLNKHKEIIDGYQPDIIWQDFNLHRISLPVLLEFLSYYYNKADEWNKEVVATYKDGLNPKCAVLDYERGGPADITDNYWLTDDAVSSSSWCYTEGLGYYSKKQILHGFLDRISKNGNLLLNISPKADGTIPQEQKDILLAMGAWLKKYGEAVYATRAWDKYGEGPTKMGAAHGVMGPPSEGTAEDIRYTRSKDNTTLYAILLGWENDQKDVVLKSLSSGRIDLKSLKSVELINGEAGKYLPLVYRQKSNGLIVRLPEHSFDELAYVLKFKFRGKIPALAKFVDLDCTPHYYIVPGDNRGSLVLGLDLTLSGARKDISNQWKLKTAGKGIYMILNRGNNKKAIECSTSGQELVISTITGKDNQLWKIEDARNGLFQISNKKFSNIMLSVNSPAAEGNKAEALNSESSSLSGWKLMEVCEMKQDAFGPNHIPGTIEAEDFDTGCAGDAFYDRDDINEGGQYRPGEGVDIEKCSAGGFNIGWTNRGEWLAYTVTVSKTATYRISFLVASAYDSGMLHLECDGADKTGIISIPNTAGFQNWEAIYKTVNLDAGRHVLKVTVDGALLNLDKMVFEEVK